MGEGGVKQKVKKKDKTCPHKGCIDADSDLTLLFSDSMGLPPHQVGRAFLGISRPEAGCMCTN